MEYLSYEWNTLPNHGSAPSIKYNSSSIVYRDCLYLICGAGSGLGRFSEVWSYDFKKTAWRLIRCSGDNPPSRDGHSTTYVGDGKVFMYGGQGMPYDNINKSENINEFVKIKTFSIREVLNDVYILDLNTLHWERMICGGHCVPLGRRGHSATYVPLSSSSSSSSSSFNDLSLSTVLSSKQQTTVLPPPRRSTYRRRSTSATEVVVEDTSIQCLDNCVIIFGGSSIDPSKYSEIFLNDTWAFSLNCNEWFKVPIKGTLPQAVFDHKAELLSNHIIAVIGGITSEGNMLTINPSVVSTTAINNANNTTTTTSNNINNPNLTPVSSVLLFNTRKFSWRYVPIFNEQKESIQLRMSGHSITQDYFIPTSKTISPNQLQQSQQRQEEDVKMKHHYGSLFVVGGKLSITNTFPSSSSASSSNVLPSSVASSSISFAHAGNGETSDVIEVCQLNIFKNSVIFKKIEDYSASDITTTHSPNSYDDDDDDDHSTTSSNTSYSRKSRHHHDHEGDDFDHHNGVMSESASPMHIWRPENRCGHIAVSARPSERSDTGYSAGDDDQDGLNVFQYNKNSHSHGKYHNNNNVSISNSNTNQSNSELDLIKYSNNNNGDDDVISVTSASIAASARSNDSSLPGSATSHLPCLTGGRSVTSLSSDVSSEVSVRRVLPPTTITTNLATVNTHNNQNVIDKSEHHHHHHQQRHEQKQKKKKNLNCQKETILYVYGGSKMSTGGYCESLIYELIQVTYKNAEEWNYAVPSRHINNNNNNNNKNRKSVLSRYGSGGNSTVGTSRSIIQNRLTSARLLNSSRLLNGMNNNNNYIGSSSMTDLATTRRSMMMRSSKSVTMLNSSRGSTSRSAAGGGNNNSSLLFFNDSLSPVLEDEDPMVALFRIKSADDWLELKSALTKPHHNKSKVIPSSSASNMAGSQSQSVVMSGGSQGEKLQKLRTKKNGGKSIRSGNNSFSSSFSSLLLNNSLSMEDSLALSSSLASTSQLPLSSSTISNHHDDREEKERMMMIRDSLRPLLAENSNHATYLQIKEMFYQDEQLLKKR